MHWHFWMACSFGGTFLTAQLCFCWTYCSRLHRIKDEWERWWNQAHYKNSPRKELLAEFDSRCMSHLAYVMLSRMTMIAPLIGVVITGIGFLTLESDPDVLGAAGAVGNALGPLHVLSATRPLFLGVILGAALASTNHMLFLPIVGHCTQRARADAETLLDKRAKSPVEEALDDLTKQLSTAAGEMDVITVKTKDMVSSAAGTAKNSIERLSTAVDEFRNAMGRITSDYHQRGGELTSALGGFKKTVQSVTDDYRQKGEDITSALTAFRTEIKDASTDVGNRIGRLGKSLMDMDARIKAQVDDCNSALADTVAQLQQVSLRLTEVAESQRKQVEQMAQDRDAAVVCAKQTLGALQQIVVGAKGVGGQLKNEVSPAISEMTDHVRVGTKVYNQLLHGAVDAVKTLDHSLTDTAKGTTWLRRSSAKLVKVIGQLDKNVQEMAAVTAKVEAELQRVSSQLRQISARPSALRRLLDWFFGSS